MVGMEKDIFDDLCNYFWLGNVQAFGDIREARLLASAPAPGDLNDATKLILPGVGAFDHAMRMLVSSGMRDTLDTIVIEEQVPVLGVCVGMQILASGSEEEPYRV